MILLGSGPQRQGVFEVAYQVNGQAAVKRRVLMPEVYSGGDFHRRSEHFHLLEFGADVRDTFAP
ncbi:MAG: hypothetical protein EXR48_04870 [Dehalococcoidia bacterium]|nr:hypothetical protein [Dehalococcoidia bacterium]